MSFLEMTVLLSNVFLANTSHAEIALIALAGDRRHMTRANYRGSPWAAYYLFMRSNQRASGHILLSLMYTQV